MSFCLYGMEVNFFIFDVPTLNLGKPFIKILDTLPNKAVLKKDFGKYLIPDFAVRKAEDFNISAKEGLPLPCIARKNSIALQDIIELSHYLLDNLKRKSNVAVA